MTTIQARTDNSNEPFVLDDSAEVKDGLTLAANQGDLTVGAVLGEIGTTSGGGVVGQLKLSAAAGTDGSQIPKYLLAENVANSTSGTSTISAYIGGLFDENQLTFGATTDLDSNITLSTDDNVFASTRDIFRSYNIRLAPGNSATGFENT